MFNSASSTDLIKSNGKPSYTPFCFNCKSDAEKAELALKKQYPEVNAYTLGKTLFVHKLQSCIINFSIEAFVREHGGRLSNEESYHLSDEKKNEEATA